MRGRIQDGLRFFISMAVRALGRHLARRLHRRVGDFSSNQQRLRKQFGIADDTLITQNPPVGPPTRSTESRGNARSIPSGWMPSTVWLQRLKRPERVSTGSVHPR